VNSCYLILPTLADTDDLVKVVIGVVFALIWIIAQVAAGAKKSRETAVRRLGLDVQPPPDAPPDPVTRLERDLLARREEAQRHRSGSSAQSLLLQPVPPHLQPPPPAQTYDEMRRRLQQQFLGQPAQPQAPPAEPNKRRRTPKPARTPRPAQVLAPIVEELAQGDRRSVGATEIGRGQARPRRAASRDTRRIETLLQGKTVRDVILAAELLRPPVALRDIRRD
jgi:hypothetical protein